jgi:hypothetical protein
VRRESAARPRVNADGRLTTSEPMEFEHGYP